MQDDHHFCRWHLPEGFDPQDTLTAAFPGCSSRTQAAHQLDSSSPKQLREVFAAVFGSPTTSNNTAWIRQKLKGALGLGGRKQRATGGTTGRKRSAGPSERSGVRAKQARANAPSPSPAGSHWGGTGAAPRRRRAAARSPSPDWAPSDDHLSLEEWGSEEWGSEECAGHSSAAVAGATALLAAAAAVESREAAIAAAAGGAGAGGSSLGQRGGGATSGSGMVTRSRQASRLTPESPGGSATGSSLSQPPTEASQEVQLFLQGFLRAAQATLAGMPTATVAAMQAAGGLAGGARAAGAAGRAPGQEQVPHLPSFLTPQQLGTAGQQEVVRRLLEALAAAPNGHPR